MKEQQFRALIAYNIIARRKELNWSRSKLASEAGISRQFVGQIENGSTSVSAYKLFQIANAMQRQVQWFLKRPSK